MSIYIRCSIAIFRITFHNRVFWVLALAPKRRPTLLYKNIKIKYNNTQQPVAHIVVDLLQNKCCPISFEYA